MKAVEILVVDSSATYKKMFAKAAAELDANASVTCVSTGKEAIDKIGQKDFEIVIVDGEVPEAGKLFHDIATNIPKAFVLITNRPGAGNGIPGADTLTRGAADFFTKPLHSSYDDNTRAIKNKLGGILKTLRNEKKETKERKDFSAAPVAPVKTVRKKGFRPGIVLIAASTGGPLAIESILSRIKKDFPAPVLIVQHTLLHSTETLAENLSQRSALRVKVAENLEPAEAGMVYIAPAGMHMKLNAENKIRLALTPPVQGVRPAADVLFESVANNYKGPGVVAIVLTGMGRDGEQGVSKLKEKQMCFCIVQSERTCVIYGMPHAVQESGLADRILDLDDIPSELESFDFA